MTAEKPHGHHVGHRWRTAPPEGDWWPERHDTPTPTRTTTKGDDMITTTGRRADQWALNPHTTPGVPA